MAVYVLLRVLQQACLQRLLSVFLFCSAVLSETQILYHLCCCILISIGIFVRIGSQWPSRHFCNDSLLNRARTWIVNLATQQRSTQPLSPIEWVAIGS